MNPATATTTVSSSTSTTVSQVKPDSVAKSLDNTTQNTSHNLANNNPRSSEASSNNNNNNKSSNNHQLEANNSKSSDNNNQSKAINNNNSNTNTMTQNNNNSNNNTAAVINASSSNSVSISGTNSGGNTTNNIAGSTLSATKNDTNDNDNNRIASHQSRGNHDVNHAGAGSSLSDSLASTDGHKTPSSDVLSKTNLYIRGLQSNTCDDDLYNMCREFGQISSTKAIIDRATGCCRGYGFVEFTEPRSAELAVHELAKSGVQAQMAKVSPPYLSQHPNHHHHNHHNHHNHSFNHNNHVQHSSLGSISSSNGWNGGVGNNNANNHGHQHNHHSSSNSNHADPTNLYIANLPPNMSEEELGKLLSNYGPVVSTRILRDPSSNIPRGVGFARMESRDKCEQIIKQLNGRPCEGGKEPLLVKFADGGNKKRHQNNHQHHHLHHNQHSNSNHHQHHKAHQDDSRWRDNGNSSDLGSASSFDHQSNSSHSNHISDLAMICPVGYPRLQPGFPQGVPTGTSYTASLVPPTSAPQWIHSNPGQPYVIPPQMMQAGSMGPTSQATTLHYGHIPQLTTQMQGLQLGHPGAPVGGYMPPQHQWPLWTHPIPQQPQSSIRLPLPMQHPSSLLSSQQQQHQPTSPQPAPMIHQQTPPSSQQHSSASDSKLQVNMPL